MEIGEVQERFAKIIWEKAPISSGELVSICDKEFGWKKSTTYTVLRRLCDKGLFANENGTVTVLMSFEEYQGKMCEEVVDGFFDGSLPAFISAFANSKKLTSEDVDDIQAMLKKFKGE